MEARAGIVERGVFATSGDSWNRLLGFDLRATYSEDPTEVAEKHFDSVYSCITITTGCAGPGGMGGPEPRPRGRPGRRWRRDPRGARRARVRSSSLTGRTVRVARWRGCSRCRRARSRAGSTICGSSSRGSEPLPQKGNQKHRVTAPLLSDVVTRCMPEESSSDVWDLSPLRRGVARLVAVRLRLRARESMSMIQANFDGLRDRSRIHDVRRISRS